MFVFEASVYKKMAQFLLLESKKVTEMHGMI